MPGDEGCSGGDARVLLCVDPVDLVVGDRRVRDIGNRVLQQQAVVRVPIDS